MMQQDDPLGSALHRALALQGLYPDNPLLIKTYSVIADMVVSGGGVGVVDIFTASRYAKEVQIIAMEKPLCFELTLISRRDKPQSRDLLLLKSMFKEQCKRIVN